MRVDTDDDSCPELEAPDSTLPGSGWEVSGASKVRRYSILMEAGCILDVPTYVSKLLVTLEHVGSLNMEPDLSCREVTVPQFMRLTPTILELSR